MSLDIFYSSIMKKYHKMMVADNEGIYKIGGFAI